MRGNTLHGLAKLLTHHAEVAFHLLDQYALPLGKKQVFHVHLTDDQFFHCLDVLTLLLIHGGNHDLLKRLSHLDIHLATQCQHHRGDLLGYCHALFQIFIDERGIGNREFLQMNRLQLSAQVAVKFVGIKRSEGCQQLGDSHQTGIKRVVSSYLVIAHLLAPEPFAVQSDVPVAEIVVHEIVDEAAGTCRIIAVELGSHSLDQRVETRKNPAIDLLECTTVGA